MLKVIAFLRHSLYWHLGQSHLLALAPITGKIESSGRLAKKRRLKSLKRRKKKIYRGEELVDNKNGKRR